MSRVIGANRLMRKLKRMPDDVADGIRVELKAASQELLDEMHSRAPVSAEPTHPEHVRDLLQARISKNGLRARIGFMGAAFRSTYFYARFLEFGTRKMRKQAFVYPAWRSLKISIQGNIREAVRQAINKATGVGGSDA